jgi:hypothetical protein
VGLTPGPCATSHNPKNEKVFIAHLRVLSLLVSKAGNVGSVCPCLLDMYEYVVQVGVPYSSFN